MSVLIKSDPVSTSSLSQPNSPTEPQVAPQAVLDKQWGRVVGSMEKYDEKMQRTPPTYYLDSRREQPN